MDQLVRTLLWTHQLEDVAKLRDQPRVLVANGMGTGKTTLAVERDLFLRKDGFSKGLPTIVVAPLATHLTWKETFDRETDLRTKVIDRKKRNVFLKTPADVFIMHYEALRLMPELQKFKTGHIIADECHRLKNRNAQQTKAARKLRTPCLTLMSGSPVTDRPQDIWQLLNLVDKKTYSSYWRFFYKFVDYTKNTVEKGGKLVEYIEVLGPADAWPETGLPAIQPFFVRRLQEDCIDIPPKLYNKLYVELTPTQKRIYEDMRLQMLSWIKNEFGEEEALPAPAVIAKLVRLQQITAGTPEFGPLDKKGNPTVKLVDPSSKVDAIMELLGDHDEHQFVIFSQFKGPLSLLKRRFESKHITYGSFTGDDNDRVRAAAKRGFIDGDRRILLSTISAGGVGVDGLQHACNNVIFIDRDWSPAINDQAEDRLHRAGQTKPVNVFDIIATGTIDFDKIRTVELKAGWVRTMLGDKDVV